MYRRNILTSVLESLGEHPVVLINGARQIGKSTLIKEFIAKAKPIDYVTLDDPTDLSSIQADTMGFLRDYNRTLAIDEVQRAPSIFIPLKKAIDERNQEGLYILTGSANVLTLPKVSESLAGRMILYTMWPLSQGELNGKKETFIDRIFKNDFPRINSSLASKSWLEIIIKGGYPQSIRSSTHQKRALWFKSYISTILQRDIRELANIERLTNIPNLLSIIAARVGNFINMSDIARIAGMNVSTIKRYHALLKMVFLTVEIPAWYTNYEKRLIKAPKIYINDTGLLCHLLNVDEGFLARDRTLFGHIFENFVVMELMKQIGWAKTQVSLYHFRTHTGYEVDLVLEGPGGHIIGLEVKSKSSISEEDFKGLKSLREISGVRFRKGIILYQGEKKVSFSEDLVALPCEALWEY